MFPENIVMRRNVFRAYFESLGDGDPVALGITLFFVLVVGVVGLIAWQSKVKMRKEDEARKNKWLKKPPK
jgi:hypothetical protein